MPATYEPIATTTLGSAASSITFSSIPATYTDLVLVVTGLFTSSGGNSRIRFNGDTGTNYSNTRLQGDGTSASSNRSTSQAFLRLDYDGNSSTVPNMTRTNIFSYAGSTNKTCLIESSEDKNGSGSTVRTVGLWRDTSAITSIEVLMSSSTFATGTIATLYGIKNA
jgi:hypothetical protein